MPISRLFRVIRNNLSDWNMQNPQTSVPISFIKNMYAVFAVANKLSLQGDSCGVLSVEFMVEPVEHKQIFVELYVSIYLFQTQVYCKTKSVEIPSLDLRKSVMNCSHHLPFHQIE
ncbi:hypothetical protein KIN20_017511 [Parelaphostrongylus tenuis]|uniref:Uncharacterized protein n=1 Tax=Parelaphostrongylus tenuis TaxID=148309 RepID=A0AAD5N370_PARTN|nr:hypothetical protein KIN20_017511 [Parelaphostrongylus tenuis]